MAVALPNFSFLSLPSNIKAALERLGAEWAAKKLDGKVSLREFLEFIAKAIDEGMVIVAPVTNGATKKDAILALAGYLFDAFEPFIVAKFGWFGWLLSLFGFTDGGKAAFLELVSDAIELFYNAKFKPAV